MKSSFRIWSLIALVLLSTWQATPARAQDQKADVIRLITVGDSHKFPIQALAMDRLMVFQFSPDWWQAMVGSDRYKGRNVVTELAGGLVDVARNMGHGDLLDTDKKSTNDGKGPLLAPMVDSWKGKISCTIILPPGLDDTAKKQVLDNLALLTSAMTNTYHCKPRSGKFLLTLRVDPKATELRFFLSKDGTQYTFVIPAHVKVYQSKYQEFLRKGN